MVRWAQAALWALLVCVPPLAAGAGQGATQEPQALTLKIAPNASLSDSWQVARAEVLEGTLGVSERLQVQNVSGWVVRGARFYAEYYDARQRRCLTALFDLSEGLRAQTGEVHPGETRILFTDNDGLFPGSQPETVTVRQLPGSAVRGPSGEETTFDGYQPATVAATSRHATDTWQRLCLGQEAGAGGPPLLDLLLAEADIDAAGHVGAMRVVDARTAQVASWFSEFAPHLRFRPASDRGSPQGARTLLLLRAVTASMHLGALVPSPRSSAWVRELIEHAHDSDVPWVNVLLLEPPPPETTSSTASAAAAVLLAAPFCLEYEGRGTGWSINIRNPR